MRKVTQFVKVNVTKEVKSRLEEDKAHFQEVIGGGKWSISDTITEYYKIMNNIKDGN